MITSLAVQNPEMHLIQDWQAALDLDVTSGEISKASRDTYLRGCRSFLPG